MADPGRHGNASLACGLVLAGALALAAAGRAYGQPAATSPALELSVVVKAHSPARDRVSVLKVAPYGAAFDANAHFSHEDVQVDVRPRRLDATEALYDVHVLYRAPASGGHGSDSGTWHDIVHGNVRGPLTGLTHLVVGDKTTGALAEVLLSAHSAGVPAPSAPQPLAKPVPQDLRSQGGATVTPLDSPRLRRKGRSRSRGTDVLL